MYLLIFFLTKQTSELQSYVHTSRKFHLNIFFIYRFNFLSESDYWLNNTGSEGLDFVL
jgi:hypothetical protein